jgi:hypothetical protein
MGSETTNISSLDFSEVSLLDSGLRTRVSGPSAHGPETILPSRKPTSGWAFCFCGTGRHYKYHPIGADILSVRSNRLFQRSLGFRQLRSACGQCHAEPKAKETPSHAGHRKHQVSARTVRCFDSQVLRADDLNRKNIAWKHAAVGIAESIRAQRPTATG